MTATERIRVMLVDDYPIMRSGLLDAMEGEGDFEVVGLAGDGVEAVSTAQDLEPDVIVMDVMIPNKDGVDACREIMGLLSGLVKCYKCRRALSGRYPRRGTFPYYVSHSLMKRGPGACDSPRLDARHFEELVVSKIRSNILTAGNIRDLVKVVDDQMDGVAGEQRKRLKTIESELSDVRGRLDRLYDLVETTDMHIDDFKPSIRDHGAVGAP